MSSDEVNESSESENNGATPPFAPARQQAKPQQKPKPKGLRDRIASTVSSVFGSNEEQPEMISIRMSCCQVGVINERYSDENGQTQFRRVGEFVRDAGKVYDVESAEALRLIQSGQATPAEEPEPVAA